MTEELLKERKEKLFKIMQDPLYSPMKIKELSVLLDIPQEQRDELKEVLDALVAEGRIELSRRGKYGKPEILHLAGTFSGTAKGFGFVTVEGRAEDIFIPAEKTGSAMHGDKVMVAVSPSRTGRRAEGEVLRILERVNETVVGYYQKNKSYGFVIPDNQKLRQDLFIPQGKDLGAVNGHKVVARITEYGSERRNPQGEIIEILGHVNDPGVDILSIVRAYGLPEAYPEEVMQETAGLPETVSAEEMAGRRDLRALPTVTIDGEDARDLDDAVTLTRTPEGYQLGVHIADVSHYVKEGSPLDTEALRRGTSVYLTDRVIPMLPHKLSNGICSLNAGVDRLALSCIMDIDSQGRIVGHEITESVICVDRRMTYTAVNAIITDHDETIMREYSEFVDLFMLMKKLSDILRERRKIRGSIDFDFPETKIILDSQGHPVDIRPYERNAATKLIEDFMLAANETVAEEYFWRELPFVYRTHENPDPEKIRRFAILINNFGYSIHMQNGEVYPKEIQKLLTKIEGTPEEALITRLALRSMKQAKYTPVCSGHFGLAARYYTHFTSPIRRYPDLQIHRIIRESLHGKLTEDRIAHYDKILTGVSAQASSTERRAEEAERETTKLKKCEYMSGHIGEVFEGVVSGVANWGFYVELPSTVEGLVRVNELRGDYYIFDEEHLELRGEMSGKTYKLGQKVRVMVSGADRLTRTVEFVPEVEW
ncbi:MAG: ribonuclease R [Clostridiales bacterium]|nr:ribonuclease R [Clostridiales bacterium]